MSKQDEQIAAFKADADQKLASLGTAIDNVAADEAAVLKKLDELNTNQELTPANQAILDDVLATLGERVTKTQALADSLPDEA